MQAVVVEVKVEQFFVFEGGPQLGEGQSLGFAQGLAFGVGEEDLEVDFAFPFVEVVDLGNFKLGVKLLRLRVDLSFLP